MIKKTSSSVSTDLASQPNAPRSTILHLPVVEPIKTHQHELSVSKMTQLISDEASKKDNEAPKGSGVVLSGSFDRRALPEIKFKKMADGLLDGRQRDEGCNSKEAVSDFASLFYTSTETAVSEENRPDVDQTGHSKAANTEPSFIMHVKDDLASVVRSQLQSDSKSGREPLIKASAQLEIDDKNNKGSAKAFHAASESVESSKNGLSKVSALVESPEKSLLSEVEPLGLINDEQAKRHRERFAEFAVMPTTLHSPLSLFRQQASQLTRENNFQHLIEELASKVNMEKAKSGESMTVALSHSSFAGSEINFKMEKNVFVMRFIAADLVVAELAHSLMVELRKMMEEKFPQFDHQYAVEAEAAGGEDEPKKGKSSRDDTNEGDEADEQERLVALEEGKEENILLDEFNNALR